MSKNFYLHGVSGKHGIELIADVVKTMAKTYSIPFITINQPGLFTQPKTKKQLAVYKIYLRDHPHQDENDFVSTSFYELKKLAATWSETYCCDIPIFDAKDIYICNIDIYLNKVFDKSKVSDFFKSTNFTIVGPSVKRQSLVEFISLLEPVFKSEHFLAGGISLEGAPIRGGFIAIVTKKGIANLSDTLRMIPVGGDLLGCSECELFLDKIERI